MKAKLNYLEINDTHMPFLLVVSENPIDHGNLNSKFLISSRIGKHGKEFRLNPDTSIKFTDL